MYKRQTYTYDGTGMRTVKTKNGETTRFYRDRGFISNKSVNGNITAANYIGAGGIFARQQDGATDYLFKNGHGDVTAKVRSGAVDKTYDYDAFGVEKNPDAGDTNTFRYCGEYFDNESGNIYLRVRYYMPGRVRFLTEDPAKDGLNWYIYCYNDPVSFADVDGRKGKKYNPSKRNDNPSSPVSVRIRTNCYAYALDFDGKVTYGRLTGEQLWGKLLPGKLSNKNLRGYGHLLNYDQIDPQKVVYYATKDAEKMGTTFREPNGYLGENEWYVCLYISEARPTFIDENGATHIYMTDYHWIRQNNDGPWPTNLAMI